MPFRPVFAAVFATLATASISPAAENAPAASSPIAPAKPKRESGWVFSFLPKSLQKNPRVDFNIFTEMSVAGKKLPAPSPQMPAYYVAAPGKMVNTGVGAEGLKGPPPEQLQRMLEKSLAAASYLAAEEPAHRPTLIIAFNWGSSSFQPPADVSDENGDGNVPVPEIVMRRALLDRALLLGGAKFAKEVAAAMEQVDQKAALSNAFAPPPGGADFMGSVGEMMPDPFDQLRARSVEMERLVDEMFSSSYFVVASAYDYAAFAKGQRLLLWRTKLTVNSLGVSMEESVPPLIASASPYFGHETKDPVVVTKKISREGHVEVGTPVVVPDKK
jgi:hypothetical protein